MAEEPIPKQYPPALAEAVRDPFDYALRLRTGELWYFFEAFVINGTWVSLKLQPQGRNCTDLETPRPEFDRDVDVRVSDIVWVAKAPHGS